jgi:uncharacterized protein
MIAIVEDRKHQLADLCRRFNVDSLELFGSTATGSLLSASSDLYFIVRFATPFPGSYLDRYLDFAEALEQIFQCPVDLLTEKAIRNPYFRQSVEATRQPIYDQRNQEAVT